MSLDANGESVPARSSLVCMSCCPHRQCSVESPRQRCCRNWPTESRSLNANGESVPFAVRTGMHFMQYNHRGSCMRRPPCRRNTITESRCRQCSVERRVGPCRRNTITEVAARASMPTESSLVSNTSSLSAPPARECLRRIEPTSKWTATTGMSFSCAPAALHSQNKACTISHGKHLQTQRLKHTVTSSTVCARTLAPCRAKSNKRQPL